MISISVFALELIATNICESTDTKKASINYCHGVVGKLVRFLEARSGELIKSDLALDSYEMGRF